MSNPVSKSLSNIPLRQFADKAGKLIIQNPFWSLLIGSLGLHGLFVLLTPSPLPKDAPAKEVTFTKLPMVQLPAKTLSPKSLLPEKSLLDNLFVKPSEPKLSSPLDSLPQPLDLANLEQLEDLPPISSSLPFGIPPLLNTPSAISPPEFVRPQLKLPTPQNSLSNLAIASRIDNSDPNNGSSSNLRSEFQGGGIRNENNQVTPAPRTSSSQSTPTPQRVTVTRPRPANSSPTKISVTPRRTAPKPTQEPVEDPTPVSQPSVPSPSNSDGLNSSAGGNILALVATDKRIKNLIDKNLLITTQIAPPETLIANPDQNREKGVAWIPAKTTNLNGKKGTIVCYWIVSPSGEIQLAGYTSGDRELVDADREMVEVVLETAKGYRFQPIDNPQSGIYRFVVARYVFP
ncbi:MAG: hypothetical protein AUK48_11875 [Oscillatoriales cyanobacterium CG2_30_44_21]|nr:MAG: hypothetical protein AUK48_11875 [Oscillatoriales cyanobacterium CG2_30_44_21]